MQLRATHSSLSYPKYRADIDGLRAIAVLSVVGYHAFPDLFKGGFIGVDIFFIISGFLISTIIFVNLQQENFSFVEFYIRRIKRIFPALTVVLGACFIFGWFVLLPDEYKQLGKHIAAGAGFTSNFILWNENGYFDSAAETKPLLHLWSLGIEEQFYIVWPLILWGAWKKKLNWLVVTVVIIMMSFLLNVKGIRDDTVATFYSPQTRFWELVFGAMLAYVIQYNKHESNRITLKNIFSFAGFVFLAFALLLITKEKPYPGMWALLPTIGTIFIIAAGSEAWLNRTFLANRILIWFGLISFPLYLWHWPLLSFAKIVQAEPLATNVRIVIVLISIFFAWMTYQFIETPLRFGNIGKVKSFALFMLLTSIGFAGYYVYFKNGLLNRFPKIIQEISQDKYSYEYKDSYRQATCFLNPDQDYKQFRDCGVTRDKSRKTILIWGDSHAAHLYPGYKKVFGDKFNIIQRTASACPPILDVAYPHRKFCKEMNDKIFELIKNEKPDKVVLTAAWIAYDVNESGLSKTIKKLKAIGMTDIDVIGPIPFWNLGLPKQLYLYFLKDTLRHRMPTRMKEGVTLNFNNIENRLQEIALKEKVNYISATNILCNNDGCMTMLGSTGDSLVIWDSYHLTVRGSEYLVSKFPA